MPEPIHRLLTDALALVERDQPRHHAALVQRWGALTLHLRVDGEDAHLRVEDGRMEVSPGPPPEARIAVRTTRHALIALIEDGLPLDDAIESGLIEIQGALDDLDRAWQATLWYLHGAVRTHGGEGLVHRLRPGPSPEPTPHVPT